MKRTLLPLVSLALAFANISNAGSCIGFDPDFNLYAFGAKDVSLGTRDSWSGSSVTATALPSSGRPPLNSNNVQCFLSQFYNALYVLGGDVNNMNAVHIFDFGAKQWSAQQFNTAGMDPNSIVAILDRDTNVFFGLSGGSLYQLDMGSRSSAQSGTISWENVGTPDYPSTYTKPVLALGDNHVHFLNMPGLDPGVAAIFVIHFAYFQPERQSYPSISGDAFPVAPGKAVSFFRGEDEVQRQFAYIPEGSSHTFVVDVKKNATTPMAPPTDKASDAVYAASRDALVQLSPSGSFYFLPFTPEDDGANTAATWQKINYELGVDSGSGSGTGSGAGSGSGSSAPVNPSATKSSSVKPSSTSRTSGSVAPSGTNSAAFPRYGSWGLPPLLLLTTAAGLLLGSFRVL